MPPWARGLVLEMRAFIRESREDRRQAAEDRKQAVEDRRQATEDRRRFAEEARRDRRQFLVVVKEITRVGQAVLQEQKKQTGLLTGINRSIRDPRNGSPGNGR